MNKIVIVSPLQMLYISKLLSRYFQTRNVECSVILNSQLEENEISDGTTYFFYCVFQIPTHLKSKFKSFIIYQLEQHTNNKISRHYQAMLQNGDFQYYFANATLNLDYCQQNIDLMNTAHGFNPKLLSIPMECMLHTDELLASKRQYDIVFIGCLNPKRYQIVEHLAKHFSVVVISNRFDTDLIPIFAQCKILLNIHYYDDAILERVRINEALHYGLMVVSEYPNEKDMAICEKYSEVVEFINIIPNDTNIDATVLVPLKNKITMMLKTYESKKKQYWKTLSAFTQQMESEFYDCANTIFCN
jgi:hypothetical protein